MRTPNPIVDVDVSTQFRLLTARDVRNPTYYLGVQDNILHFADVDESSTTTVDPAVPIASRITSVDEAGTHIVFSGHAGRNTFFKKTTVTSHDLTATSPALDISNAGLKGDFNDTEFLVGTFGFSSNPYVARYHLSDATLASASAEVTDRVLDGASTTKKVRIETVCELDGVNSLMVIGIHDITNKLSTLEFWVVGPTNHYQLDTTLQVVLPDTETWAHYDSGARYCANVYAINNGNGYTMVANDLATGRAVQFRWNPDHGIESQLQQVIQIDADASTVTFTPTGLRKINELYYLSGRFSRPMTDGTIDTYAAYLTSNDAWNWSVGERSFLISGDNAMAQLVDCTDLIDTIYAIGYQSDAHGVLYQATARVIDVNGTPTELRFIKWSLDQGTDAGDSVAFELASDNPVKEGQTLIFEAGWKDDDDTLIRVKMGEYVAVQLPDDVTIAGPQTEQVQGIDVAFRLQNEWIASVDVAQASRTMHTDSLDALDKLIVKTIMRDVKVKSQSDPANVKKAVTLTDGALYSESLNDPLIAYSTERDNRDGMWYAEVEFAATDDGCQQSFGFVFGASATKFNAVLIPKVSDWTGHRFDDVGPILVKSDLQPKDAVSGLGEWVTSFRIDSLIETSLGTTPGSVLVTKVDAINTAAYRPTGAWSFAAGHKYQVALRKHGCRLQVFTKIMDYTPENCIDNAVWAMVAEFKLDDSVQNSWDDRPYCGIALATDVWVSTQAFAEAEYGDIDTAIAGAGYFDWVDTYTVGQCSFYLGLDHQGGPEESHGGHGTYEEYNGNNDHLQLSGVTEWPPEFAVGATFSVYGPDSGTSSGITIKSMTDDGSFKFEIDALLYGVWWWYADYGGGVGTYTTKGFHASESMIITGPGLSQDYGYARSGYEVISQTILGTTVLSTTDSGVVKRTGKSRGKSFTINDGSDSTAEFTRFASSDGANHVYMSGNSGGSAFDLTNPIANPRVWSFKMNPSLIMPQASTDFGLPDEGYFKLDDEYVRFRNEMFPWFGGSLTEGRRYNHWCMVPTDYFVLTKATAGETGILNLMQWLSSTFGEVDSTGGMFDYTNVKGMLAEIRSRTNATNITTDSSVKYYVASTTPNNDDGHVSYGNNHFVTLDKPYPNDIVEPGAGQAADILIVSGRAQLGTDKSLHDAAAPVVFYPMPLTDPATLEPLPWLIRVDSFDQFQGLFMSTEDDLKYTCAMAGIRNTHFRSLGNYTGVLSTTPVTLASDVSNFVLDIKAHLYGDADNRLQITFRGGKYILDLRHHITADSLANGRMGDIEYRLQAPDSGVTLGAHDAKWLDQNTIALGSRDISGVYADETHTEDTAIQLSIRIAARDNLIAIEVEGQQVWTINLDRFSYLDGDSKAQNYTVLTPGTLTISRSATSTLPVTARLQELAGEIEYHIIDMGSSLAQALGFLLDGRHIWSRSEPDSGVLFTTNMTRENWSYDSSIVKKYVQDSQLQTVVDIAGHIIVTGAEFGGAMDVDWIKDHGYLFTMGNNRLLNTVQDSRDEARIVLRVAREHAMARSLTGPALLDIQPLDKFSVQRDAVGDIKAIASTAYVVQSVHLEGDPNGIIGSLETFKELP